MRDIVCNPVYERISPKLTETNVLLGMHSGGVLPSFCSLLISSQQTGTIMFDIEIIVSLDCSLRDQALGWIDPFF